MPQLDLGGEGKRALTIAYKWNFFARETSPLEEKVRERKNWGKSGKGNLWKGARASLGEKFTND